MSTIPSALNSTPLVDPDSGLISRPWVQYLNASLVGASGGSGSAGTDTVTFVTDTNAALTVGDEIVVVTAIASECAITLPDATASKGMRKAIHLSADSTLTATVAPAGTDTLQGSTDPYTLAAAGNTVVVESTGTDWAIVGFWDGAGGSGGDAANVTGATVTVNYGLFGNASAYGLSAVITLPSDTSNLQQIHIQIDGQDGDIGVLYAPWSGATVPWTSGDPGFLQDSAAVTRTLTFLCENQSGKVSASPLTVAVPIEASAVTSVTASETGTRTSAPDTRLVHMTVSLVPVLASGQVPQNVTYWISQDAGANFIWVGWQKITTVGQSIEMDRLVPGPTSTWKVAASAGAIGGDPTILVALADLPGAAVVSPGFSVTGLMLPGATDITTLTVATPAGGINPYNVVDPSGRQYFSISTISYNDTGCLADAEAFYVRITAQDYGSGVSVGPEQPFDGAQASVSGQTWTFGPLLGDYGTVGYGYIRTGNIDTVRLRVYVCNRLNQTAASFQDATCATLQIGGGGDINAGYLDVTVGPPPGVSAVTGAEIGPRYQDENQGLHTVVGLTPTIANNQYPQDVTLWINYGDGRGNVWQGWFTISTAGQQIQIGAQTLGSDGVRLSGTIWVPANTSQGTWTVYAIAGTVNNGPVPAGAVSSTFTVTPVGACAANDVTNAVFVPNPTTGDRISYALYNPGTYCWDYYELQYNAPSVAVDFNYWFSMCSVQKGYPQTGTGTVSGGTTLTDASTTFTAAQVGNDIHVAGVLTTIASYVSAHVITLKAAQPNGSGIAYEIFNPAPDYEGANEDPQLNYLGRRFFSSPQIQGLGATQVPLISSYGANPANWTIPLAKNVNGTINLYRTYRFRIYCISRLGTDSSGSGGAGTYTLQNVCWPGGADHYDLVPASQAAATDLTTVNPLSLSGPLSGGNGAPVTVSPGSISSGYLAAAAVQATNMAANAITAANGALAASSVVDSKIVSVGMNKVTYGTSIFAGDVVMSRGLNLPVVVLNNVGLYMFGQADASTGATGLTTKPYVVVQNTGVGIFGTNTSSTNYPSCILNASAMTFYSANADSTKPYVQVSASGVTVSSGGTASVVITPSSVTITNGVLTLNLNGVTTQIQNNYNSTLGAYQGISVTDNSTSAVASILPSMFFAAYSGTIYANMKAAGTNATLNLVNATKEFTVDVTSSALNIKAAGLPSTRPSAGNSRLWYDPTDSNRVKFEP